MASEKTLWVNNFHYQNADKLKEGAVLELEFEPDNPHDPNAIAVFAKLGFIFKRKTKVGYIPKNSAKWMQGKPLPVVTVDYVNIRNVFPDDDDEDDFYTTWKIQIKLT